MTNGRICKWYSFTQKTTKIHKRKFDPTEKIKEFNKIIDKKQGL